jgi:hypothetical protein
MKPVTVYRVLTGDQSCLHFESLDGEHAVSHARGIIKESGITPDVMAEEGRMPTDHTKGGVKHLGKLTQWESKLAAEANAIRAAREAVNKARSL